MQLKQWFRDHNRRVFPAVFAAIIGLLFIAFNFSSIEQSFVQQPFDAAKWRQNLESGLHDSTRLQMADDLLRRHSLHGMTRHEIEALLGKPQKPMTFATMNTSIGLGRSGATSALIPNGSDYSSMHPVEFPRSQCCEIKEQPAR